MRFLTLALLLLASFCHAQQVSFTDSIRGLLPTAADTTKVQLLIELADYYKKSHPDSCIVYATQSLDLAARSNYPRGVAVANNFIGLGYKNKGELKEGIRWYLKAVRAWKELNNPAKEAAILVNAGNAYKRLDMHDSALFYQLTALRIRESIGDEASLSNSYKATADVYFNLQRFEKAIAYYRQAERIHAKRNDTPALASIRSDIGLTLYKESRYREGIEKLMDALHMYTTLQDDEGIGFAANNLALCYQGMNRYDEALSWYKKALVIKEKLGDKRPVANTLYNIGNVYYETGKCREATLFLKNSLDIGIGIGSLEIKKSCYDILARVARDQGQFREAYNWQQLYTATRDSIFNTENAERIEEMRTKYETEKKDLEIGIKNVQLEKTTVELNKRNVQLVSTVAAGLVILLLGYLFYSRYKLRQKQALDAEIIHQQSLRSKAIIEAEEKERIRIAKDLHDGVGQQLSAVKMNLSAYEASINPENTEQKSKVQLLMNLVDESVKEVRSVSHQMMPNALIRSGLVSAVRSFIDKISAGGALKVDLEIIGLNERLEGTTENVLYRVMQECVSNIVRHARASYVSIQLIRHDNHLNMLLEDNGIGFEITKMNDFAGIGLRNIVSRVEYLNGTVDFDSTPGKGTTVNINIPLS